MQPFGITPSAVSGLPSLWRSLCMCTKECGKTISHLQAVVLKRCRACPPRFPTVGECHYKTGSLPFGPVAAAAVLMELPGQRSVYLANLSTSQILFFPYPFLVKHLRPHMPSSPTESPSEWSCCCVNDRLQRLFIIQGPNLRYVKEKTSLQVKPPKQPF